MNWRIRLTWWDKALLAIMAAAVVITVVRFAAGIGSIANINNAYPWGWWVGYGIMTMIAIGGVGFTITGLVEVLGAHRYHSFLRPAVLMAFLCYVSAITMLMVELGRPWKVWMVLVSWAPTSALYEVGWCAFLYLSVLAFEFAQVPAEELRLRRVLKVIRTIYIPIMLLGVTLSHLHQSSLGTLLTLIPHKINELWWSDLLPLIFLFSAMMAGPAVAILEHLAAARWLGFAPRMDLLARLARIEAGLVALCLALQVGDLFYRGAAGAMLSPDRVRRPLLDRNRLRPAASARAAAHAGGPREPARARHRVRPGGGRRAAPPPERSGLRAAGAALGDLRPLVGRDRHHRSASPRGPCSCSACSCASCPSTKRRRRVPARARRRSPRARCAADGRS